MGRPFFKKSFIFLLASAALAASGCAAKREPVIVEVSSFTAVPVATLPPVASDVFLETLAPAATALPFNVSPTPYMPHTPTPAPTSTPFVTPRPTENAAGEPTAAASGSPSPTPSIVTRPPNVNTPIPWYPQPGQADQSVFDNCAFVGNSLFEALEAYGVVTHGDFFATVGLNLNTVYTETATHGSIPVINELNSGSYLGVLLMFGQNELGWPSYDAFIQKYADLIRDVKSRQPNARVFITAMPPVTKALSDKNADGVTNENITRLNARLAELATQFGYCRFITVPDSLYDANNALPAQASGDGIHLNMTYSRLWVEHLCMAVAAGLAS